MDGMLGAALFGFQQGRSNAQQAGNPLGQLAALGATTFSGCTTTTDSTSNTIYIRGVSNGTSPVKVKKSLRQELQAEVDEWLPLLVA